MKKSTAIATALILGSVVSMTLMRSAKAQQPPAQQENPMAGPWDENRRQEAYNKIEANYEGSKKSEQEAMRGYGMIETKENKPQLDALRASGEGLSELQRDADKLEVDIAYAEANNQDASELKQRYDALNTEYNNRADQYNQNAQPFQRDMDILVAEGKLNLESANPEFIEQYRQEHGIQPPPPEVQPPEIQLPPGYEEKGEKDWDQNRLDAARQQILTEYTAEKKIDDARLKGLDMIERTPENAQQIDALKNNLKDIAEVAAEARKASVDLSYLEANNMDTTEARQRYESFTNQINERNAAYGESMRTLGQPLDELVAKGQLDAPAYNPEFVEQYQQEQGIQVEQQQPMEQPQEPEQQQPMEQPQQPEQQQPMEQPQQMEPVQGMTQGQ